MQNVYVAHVVMKTWVGACPDGLEILHGPNGVTDNSVGNLCYGTHKQNALDCRRDGTYGGRDVIRSDGVEFPSLTVAAEESSCCVQGIWQVCNGRGKTAGGYEWKYA